MKHDRAGVAGVVDGPVEGMRHGNVQFFHRLVQRQLILAVAQIEKVVKLLEIIIQQRIGEGTRNLVVGHVPLKLREIHIAPGAEHRAHLHAVLRFRAPFHKLPEHFREGLSSLPELIHSDVHDLQDFEVKSSIDDRLNETRKLTQGPQPAVQLYRPDLYNFKRKLFDLSGLSFRALIPFQVKYNVPRAVIGRGFHSVKIFHIKKRTAGTGKSPL